MAYAALPNQGLVSCAKCGYALSRTSTPTSARKIHYYKCIGSDSWRKLGGPVCDNGRFVRQELLDHIVWAEVIRLLEEPALIQQELDRRLLAARASDPTRKREQGLQQELTHVGKAIERLLNAYQEGLLSLEQLRERMPALRHRQQTLRAELQAIADQTKDRAAFLRLAETLTAFLARLRSAAETLSVIERQQSYDCWSKKFWSAKTPSPFVTAFRFLRVRPKAGDPGTQTVQITFCVRGVVRPPVLITRQRSS